MRRMFSRFGAILCMASIALTAGQARSAGLTTIPGTARVAQTGQAVWTIQADKLMHDQDKQLYEAEGNVKISSKDRMIEADYALLNDQTRQADLNGKVTVQYGRNWVKGEHIIWNLDTETGWVDSGVIYFAENNFFVQGKSISKLSPTEYDLKEGFITSCNPADPDWKIQFNSMKVAVGGTAWTQDASFWTRNLPIAYSPVLVMPVETQRQSGFLFPLAGDSSLNGFMFEIPFYWAIRPDMDATFYANYMTNRGLMGGLEYRINSQELGRGIWMFNFLDDQVSTSRLLDYGYSFETQDRYWLRGLQDIVLPWNIEAKIDVDYVSDGNFLQEFGSGSGSFLHTNVQFERFFGRSLLYDQTSLVRESAVYLEKKDQSDLLSMDVRYWENLESSLAPETTQKLPSFSFSMIPQWIDGTPLYYTLDSSAVNYWRRQDDTEQRLDLFPQVFYPMHWNNYLKIEPSVGFRTNAYSVQWEGKGSDEFVTRGVPDVEVELSTRLNREFTVDFWNFSAMQHSIRPEVSYEYATQTTSDRIPQLDRLDEDQSRNGIRYGFSTFLTGKQVVTDSAGEPVTEYRELARFRVFQFFNVEPPPVEDPLFDTDNVMRQGFSPVGFRVDMRPKQYLTVSYDLDYDFSKLGQGTAQDLFLTFDSTAGHIVRLDYEQIPNLAISEITASTVLKAYTDIYLATYHDYSLERGLIFTQGYGVRYVRGCWGVGAGYERVGSDNRFVFTVDLLGIGSLGGQSAFFGRPLFGESIPGYQHPESWILAR